MKRKVSTVLDEALFRRVKIESARQGRQISELVSEALEAYLREPPRREAPRSIARSSFGAMKAPKSLVRSILEDEDGPFDA